MHFQIQGQTRIQLHYNRGYPILKIVVKELIMGNTQKMCIKLNPTSFTPSLFMST